MGIEKIVSRFSDAVLRRVRNEDMIDVITRRLHSLGPVGPIKNPQDDVIIICPLYPGGGHAYGGEFIQKRAESYCRAGLKVSVLETSPQSLGLITSYINGVRVVRCTFQGAADYLSGNPPKSIAAHQVEKPVWEIVKPWIRHARVSVWIHGAEARHWNELNSSYSPEEIKKLRRHLDRQTNRRRQTMAEILANRDVKKIVVSNFMASVVQNFTGVGLQNGEVIHNPILSRDFPYVAKKASDRCKVLWVRSFNSYNYANDLSRDALLWLSKRPNFHKLKFTVQGDGHLFNEMTKPLAHFENVNIRQGFIDVEELRNLHKDHGIMLVPSRWDSQGLTCGEAMASGLVPITTKVAAVPEFVDDRCGVLCPADDAAALGQAIENLMYKPDLYLKKSAQSAKRAAKQCGYTATIEREIGILKAEVN